MDFRAHYERIVSQGGSLTGFLRRRRELFLLFCFFASVAAALIYAPRLGEGSFTLGGLAILLGLVGNLLVVGIGLCGLTYTPAVFIGWLAVQVVAVLMIDISFYVTDLQSGWPIFVLLVDFALVLRLDNRVAGALVTIGVVWMVVTWVEKENRFGLYDLPLLPSQEQRRQLVMSLMECEALPCPPASNTAVYQGFGIFVFLFDFIATRGFARQVDREQAAMKRTVETVQGIAILLADYDVDRVAEILAQCDEQLPAAMHAALQCLETNLRSYRPYLPKSCIQMRSPPEADTPGAAPSAPGVGVEAAAGHDEDSSTTQSSASPAVEPLRLQVVSVAATQRPTAPQWGILRDIRLSLMEVNVISSLQRLDRDLELFAAIFGNVLEETLRAVEKGRGIVDVFIGDRIMSSFNASRRCSADAEAACGAAKSLMFSLGKQCTAVANIGIASGRAKCGDMGCSELRRFSIIGELVSEAHAVERAGRALGVGILCSANTWQSAHRMHSSRLVPRLLRITAASECLSPDLQSPLRRVFEVLLVVGEKKMEWMYEFKDRDWSDYNEAIEAFIEGRTHRERMEESVRLQYSEAVQRMGSRQPLVVHV